MDVWCRVLGYLFWVCIGKCLYVWEWVSVCVCLCECHIVVIVVLALYPLTTNTLLLNGLPLRTADVDMTDHRHNDPQRTHQHTNAHSAAHPPTHTDRETHTFTHTNFNVHSKTFATIGHVRLQLTPSASSCHSTIRNRTILMFACIEYKPSERWGRANV